MTRRYFDPGQIIQHFKRTMLTEDELKENPTAYLYEYVGTAKHTETGEYVAIYRSFYQGKTCDLGKLYVRPLEMFYSEVDKEKYPNVKQKYRFEGYILATMEG